MSNSGGVQEIILTCQIPTSFASALRRRRRPCWRGQAVSAAVLSRTPHPPIQSATSSTRPKPLSPVLPSPEPSPLMSPPAPLPPPAKRRRKAAKRRSEVELLRGVGVEDDFYVPPLILTPPPARSPPPPSRTPTASPISEQSLNYRHYSQLELRIPPQHRLWVPPPRHRLPRDRSLRRHRWP